VLTDGTSNCSVHGRSRAVKVNTVVASRQKYLYAHSETHCNELVSGQIHAPAALFPALMPVLAVCRMLVSLSLLEIDPSIPGIGPIA